VSLSESSQNMNIILLKWNCVLADTRQIRRPPFFFSLSLWQGHNYKKFIHRSVENLWFFAAQQQHSLALKLHDAPTHFYIKTFFNLQGWFIWNINLMRVVMRVLFPESLTVGLPCHCSAPRFLSDVEFDKAKSDGYCNWLIDTYSQCLLTLYLGFIKIAVLCVPSDCIIRKIHNRNRAVERKSEILDFFVCTTAVDSAVWCIMWGHITGALAAVVPIYSQKQSYLLVSKMKKLLQNAE
jgi:hypothetical protein